MAIQDNKVKEEITSKWDVSSETYDAHHGHGVKSDEEAKAWKKAFDSVFPKGKLKVLDVGCGTGEISMLLASMGHQVTGLDLSDKMMEKGRIKAKERGLDIKFQLGDAEYPPFDDGTFDVVINRHLLWTLPHPQEAINSWRRVLKDGGVLVVIDGVWDDGSLETRIRSFIAGLGVLICERKDPWSGYYSKEIKSKLPNTGGTPLERSNTYLSEAGFKDIRSQDIRHIRDIQRSFMPWYRRMGHTYKYYMINGKK